MKTFSSHIGVWITCCGLLLFGCGDIQPLWMDARTLDSLTLYFSQPLEFDVEVSHPEETVETMMELAVTYDLGINRNTLPLHITLEDPEHNVQEFDTDVRLKAEGEWLGFPEEIEVDYTVTHVAVLRLPLRAGIPYQMKLYANDEAQEKIYGIIRLTVRLYEADALQETN